MRNLAIGAGIGAIAGQSRNENRDYYTAVYSASGAGIAAATSLLIDDPFNELSSLKESNESLRGKLSAFERQQSPELVNRGNSLFSSPLPKEVAGLVEPGEWKRYKLDQWVQDPNQPNTWYRQVEMFEIIPPVSR